MPLRDFQIQASDFLIGRDYALYCDDAGLGKSAVVLDAADRLALPRVLCVGPAVAGVSWPVEVAKWSPARTFVNLDVASNFGFSLPGFYFVSYDTLSLKANASLLDRLVGPVTWDLLVLDEGQYLKNPGANRTAAVYGYNKPGLAHFAHRVWVLSGTLTPNHAGEAYTHLANLFPEILQTVPAFKGRVPEQYEFEDHFCRVRDTVYGRVMEGSKNQKELRAALAPVLLRRRKADVLTDLAPMEWFTAPIKADPAVIDAELRRVQALLGVPGAADPEAKDEMGQTPRRLLGLAKVPGCVQWIEDRLASGEPKIVVFAHHRSVLTALYDALLDHDPVVFHGGTSHAERTDAVSRFQNDPKVRVFIGQLHAAGTAITLTAARTVFFAEYAGTPGVNFQCASRAHRMGQRDGVQVYFGTVPKSLDEKIAATAARRAREIAEIFD